MIRDSKGRRRRTAKEATDTTNVVLIPRSEDYVRRLLERAYSVGIHPAEVSRRFKKDRGFNSIEAEISKLDNSVPDACALSATSTKK
jgi:hypothetical protein